MSETPDSPNSPNSDAQVTLKLRLDPPPKPDLTEARAASGGDPVPWEPGDYGERRDHEPPVADPADARTSSAGNAAPTNSPMPIDSSAPIEPPVLPEPPTFGEIVDGHSDVALSTANSTSHDVADASRPASAPRG